MHSISCRVYTPKQSHSSTSSLNPKKNPTSPVKSPPSNDDRWRASKRSLHPKAQISLSPFLFKFESTPKASFGLLSQKKEEEESHNVKMDGFIHKRRKREPKAKNGVVKLNSELFSGSISVIGRQRVMEDAVKVVHEFVSVAGNPYDFFGVYDGHGGARVASACKERMHALLEKEVVVVVEEEEEGGGVVVEWEKVMRSCFWKMDEEVRTGGGGTAKVEMVGSTAVVVVVGKEEVVVANCGDSRAVLCRGGVAVPLSRDHKPDRADEMERVEAAGGRILNWNGSRVLGVLATSRSIGDHYLRPYVISEPEVTVTERTELDDFLVIASDGLWDVVSNEFACEVARRCFDGQIKRRISEVSSESTAGDAAAILAELAMSRGSNDNISVIVVELKK